MTIYSDCEFIPWNINDDTSPVILSQPGVSGNLYRGLATDDSYVYWIEEYFNCVWHYYIKRVVKSGGQAEILHAAPLIWKEARDLCIDETHLYWREEGIDPAYPPRIKKMPKAGSEAPVTRYLDDLEIGLASIALQGDFLYFSETEWNTDPDNRTGKVLYILKSGGAATDIDIEDATGLGRPHNLIVHNEYLYWQDADGIKRWHLPDWQIDADNFRTIKREPRFAHS